MKSLYTFLYTNLWVTLIFFVSFAHATDINLIDGIDSIEVPHHGKIVKITRNQDSQAKITGEFARTSRNCPPFCPQPISAGEGVRTIGEKELILFMANHLKQNTGLLIDARTASWFEKETIPGSINIPYTQLNKKFGADDFSIEEALILFGAEKNESSDEESWDFFDAKLLAVWCNGPWCGQSHGAIEGLLSLGYPADKILYYRGGMQVWKIFGLTTVVP